MLTQRQTVDYPTSDGKPMAETDVHREQIIQLILALQDHFRSQQDVYVTGNLLMLYDKSDGHKHLSPDVMVVRNVESRERDSYKLWEEGKAPDTVIEITSASTRDEDLGPKKELYRKQGVPEYFIFDPLREYLPAQLQGYRLREGRYVRTKRCVSAALGLELRIVKGVLRLWDPVTGRLLPVHIEVVQKWLDAEKRAEEAEAAAVLLGQRIQQEAQRRLRAEVRAGEAEARGQTADLRSAAADARLAAEVAARTTAEARRVAAEARLAAEVAARTTAEARGVAAEARLAAEVAARTSAEALVASTDRRAAAESAARLDAERRAAAEAGARAEAESRAQTLLAQLHRLSEKPPAGGGQAGGAPV